MEAHSLILVAFKRVVNCTGNEILKMVLKSLNKFEHSTKQFLIPISDGAARLTCNIHNTNNS